MLDFEQLKRDISALLEHDQQLIVELVAQLKERHFTDQSPQPLNLTQSEFVGMWSDRPELQDSSAWVKQIRYPHWRS